MNGDVPAAPEMVLLSDFPDPAAMRDMAAEGLTSLVEQLREEERRTLEAMAPFDARLREIRARMAVVATENRRRERAERHAARVAVREQARSGELPTLAQALEAGESPLADALSLAALPVFLATGGEARIGYPTRPGSISFTDGRSITSATTWGAARHAYSEGMEPGTPTVPGVRIHLVGTRIEKVVPAGELLVGGDSPRAPGA